MGRDLDDEQPGAWRTVLGAFFGSLSSQVKYERLNGTNEFMPEFDDKRRQRLRYIPQQLKPETFAAVCGTSKLVPLQSAGFVSSLRQEWVRIPAKRGFKLEFFRGC